ncbi:putative membrane protein YhhN [Humibacillus xanthopallidus]|uniref:Putative membrane protein YhhN n=1 Tax=Humibacillus xanthopallidus TaxID=412689 RepID=A0A543PKK8_9MICO|nr:lysoplasmalogenase [Humibacillus xanthopallidus]TQN44610.1 putative membrane protein YhhN [Humibacillus xanthopallidus]
MGTASTERPRRLGLVAAAFVAVAGVHLVLQLADATGLLSDITQDLLMPLLALTLVAATVPPRSRLVRWVLVALGFSFLGDAVPDFVPGDLSFLAMVGAFLLAQVAYIVAFWPLRGGSVMRRPALLLPYAVVFVALVVACREGAGAMLVPVVVYGAALVTMAALSTGVSLLAGVGGAVFLVSDALIALHEFAGLDLPRHGFWVMLTYVVGQALIVAGVVGRERSSAMTTAAAAAEAQGSRSSR